jgi:hypothetical protein
VFDPKDCAEDIKLRGFTILDGVTPQSVITQLGRRVGQSEELTPRAREAASPWSLSGTYGTGPFPWHTDGAVSTDPPRWIVLYAKQISGQTYTELLDPGPDLQLKLRRTVLRVTDNRGRVRHLPASLPTNGGSRLRWDPRVGTPLTGASLEEVEEQEPSLKVSWMRGRMLIFDNFRLMHRRPAVSDVTERVIERTYVWGD